MNKMQQQVAEFARACDVYRSATPALIPEEAERKMRLGLIQEEVRELEDAMNKGDLVAIADAIADTLYVVYGMADAHGLDMEPLFDEVHASNMRKVGTDGKVTRRADGKILKPDGWRWPDLGPIIQDQVLRGSVLTVTSSKDGAIGCFYAKGKSCTR